MAKYKRLLCVILAFLLAFSLGSVASVPAHAIVLDPVAWLYPIWQAYAMQAGITVTTVGGDSFTQDSFTGLFNEWQAFEVSQGVQSVAQSISGFVDDAVNFVEVVAGSGSGGVLNTVLKLEAGIVGPLSRFWNWIVVDKLGASSVDSTDFSSLTVTGSLIPLPAFVPSSGYQLVDSGLCEFRVIRGSHSGSYLYASSDYVSPGVSNIYLAWVQNYRVYYSSVRSSFVLYQYYTDGSFYGLNVSLNSSMNGYNYIAYPMSSFSEYVRVNGSYYDSFEDLFGSESSSGSIHAVPDVGVDVLGFPDARDPDYVPADTNIGWNVPYDPTADTNAYLDQAYQQALDNELDESGPIDDPVTGTDEVGDVGEYVVPGLSEVFPFCLPFDVCNFLSALAADPVAPSFTAELAFPEQLGGSRYIEIDFDNSTFNQLASILRTMELLLFIVGLAYVTRSKFIRG